MLFRMHQNTPYKTLFTGIHSAHRLDTPPHTTLLPLTLRTWLLVLFWTFVWPNSCRLRVRLAVARLHVCKVFQSVFWYKIILFLQCARLVACRRSIDRKSNDVVFVRFANDLSFCGRITATFRHQSPRLSACAAKGCDNWLSSVDEDTYDSAFRNNPVQTSIKTGNVGTLHKDKKQQKRSLSCVD